ncbi:PepSY domain-containing protein [Alysiella filiformis]|uniref:Peptidase propeptide and YPEB domain-containing protein n=1 Tax=Alysiella filiformis DSM 16848 TaxID=1120981 RepID=A0A286EEK5_9NEIS|nr:PepSY domain-containing protein [Alysiella filiformis]QMT31650.1 PepSY domain-containing protein [Alysiella filiformis]UBQ55339.1 PepSY domain-containing protein [Alysiella filiformis DSM 16848]SOD69343.1 Peptidase propeptide and YPEB domain-containing protein [Alysiella filiformis DSM 16848]
MNHIKKISLLALTAFTFVSAPAWADDDWDDDDDDRRRPRAAYVHKHSNGAPKISRERAIAIAKSRYHGARVTDVDLERKRGRSHYQVDLKDGRYDYEVWIDAQSGKITHSKKELDD